MSSRLVKTVASLVLLLAADGHAEVQRFVDAQFRRPDGTKSVPVRREVTFLTGAELKKRSSEREYSLFTIYALFAYDSGSFTFIIELQDAMAALSEPFGDAGFKKVFSRASPVEGIPVNADATVWYLQAKAPSGRWIDPRVPEGR